MNSLLPSYPHYKDSGIPWLGKIPSHWDVERAKWFFKKMERPVREDDDVVTCFRDGMVTLRKNRRVTGFTESLKEIGYQGVRKGDLVIHIMDAAAGAMGVSDSDGKCTPVYIVATPNKGISTQYFAFLLREMARQKWIDALAKGIRERSVDFRYNTFGAQFLPVPPSPEQTAIAHYLEWINSRIQRLIRVRQKQMKLLEEQKQSVIQQAVTGDIDVRTGQPYLAYKDSSVEWLGKVPEHWDILRSKFIFREVDERSKTGLETHLSMSQKFGLIHSSRIGEKRLLSESYIGGKVCRENDLVLNRLKAHLGVFALAPKIGVVSPDYTILRAHIEISEKYFEYVLKTPTCRGEFIKRVKGIVVGFWRLYTNDFYDISLPVPPVEEQYEIVEGLEIKLQEIISSIEKLNERISVIREYRTRLIADVVTGKVDVCQVAAQLPEIESNGVILEAWEEENDLDDLEEAFEEDRDEE